MTTKNKEDLLLGIAIFVFLIVVLTGSFITSGNILDLIIMLVLLAYIVQYSIIKIQERKK